MVSNADLDTERAIREVLRRHRPHDAVVGEEHGATGGSKGVQWLVDPIDGTTSYLYGRPDWAVSVAAVDGDGLILCGAVAEPDLARLTWASRGHGTYVNGERATLNDRTRLDEVLMEVNLGTPAQHRVAGTMVDALLPSVRDLRRGGSAAASLAGLAAGRADAVWSPGIQSWDGAAGVLLVLEAGGVVGDLDGPSGGRWPRSGDVLAAHPELWSTLRKLLAPAYAA